MKGMYRIAVLDMNAGHANQGMRCINMIVDDFVKAYGITEKPKVFEIRNDANIPNVNDFDIFISSGGPGSPILTGEKWERKYFKLLDAIFDHNLLNPQKKYLFLICHSFQLACQHWKLAKATRRKSTSFGIMPVHKTKKGRQEPLLEGLNDPFYAVDSRDYQIVKPKKKKIKKMGGKILCKEKIRPHIPLERAVMAIRFSDEIFGTQFHPEADAEGMYHYFSQEEKKQHIIKHHGREKYHDMLLHLEDDDKILKTERTIIPRFLQIAHSEIAEQHKLMPV